jgi:integrase
MTLDRITAEEVDSLRFTGSPSYVNQALRTLRRLLGKAVEWNIIAVAPKIKLLKEQGREQTIEPDTEARSLAVAIQPMKDVLIIIQDTGMRPEEIFRIQIENIDWTRRVIFNPHGETSASRRRVPISERMFNLLMLRCAGKQEGWLFPSSKAECGHLMWPPDDGREAGLPESLVLYCARHTFGTAAYEATGNLAMVMKVMGHTDVRTSMRYQHPGLESIREAIDQRNLRHNSRQSELSVQ